MRAACAWVLLLAAGSAAAAPVRLDDTASPRQRVEATVRWEHDSIGELDEEKIYSLIAEVRGMEFRLNTAAYVGQEAQIFLTVPRFIRGLRTPDAMRVTWTTGGRLVAGSLRPGDRALVFQGKISTPLITELFDFRIHIDGRQLDRGLEFEPIFEIELPGR